MRRHSALRSFDWSQLHERLWTRPPQSCRILCPCVGKKKAALLGTVWKKMLFRSGHSPVLGQLMVLCVDSVFLSSEWPEPPQWLASEPRAFSSHSPPEPGTLFSTHKSQGCRVALGSSPEDPTELQQGMRDGPWFRGAGTLENMDWQQWTALLKDSHSLSTQGGGWMLSRANTWFSGG